jgi:hypothetical protein
MEYPNMVVDSKVYNTMMDSAIELYKEIEHNHKNGNTVTVAEANFANAFGAYAYEIIKVLREQGLGDEKNG